MSEMMLLAVKTVPGRRRNPARPTIAAYHAVRVEKTKDGKMLLCDKGGKPTEADLKPLVDQGYLVESSSDPAVIAEARKMAEQDLASRRLHSLNRRQTSPSKTPPEVRNVVGTTK
jgi:hypothetical protein